MSFIDSLSAQYHCVDLVLQVFMKFRPATLLYCVVRLFAIAGSLRPLFCHTQTQGINSVPACITLLDSRPRTDTRAPLQPATAVSCQGVRERKIRLRASLDISIENPNSHLFGLSGPQPLDSYRLETSSRLRANQALSLAGFEPNHDELRYQRKREVSTP
jgi:hypothetical protein